MSKHQEMLIVRQFSDLNAKNLLYYEAELAHLELELTEVEVDDLICSENPRAQMATRWSYLAMTYDDALTDKTNTVHPDRDTLQWRLVERTRETLHKYSKFSRISLAHRSPVCRHWLRLTFVSRSSPA